MSVEVTREEFEARVGTLEREVEGEKLVTRYILEQSRRNGDDLAVVKTRLERLEGKFDNLEGRFDNLERRFDALDGKVNALRGDVDGLTKSLPQIVGEVMREVLDEHVKKR